MPKQKIAQNQEEFNFYIKNTFEYNGKTYTRKDKYVRLPYTHEVRRLILLRKIIKAGTQNLTVAQLKGEPDVIVSDPEPRKAGKSKRQNNKGKVSHAKIE